MKKDWIKSIALTVIAAASLSAAKADIVVQGKATNVNHSGGNTYVKCRKKGECIRIKSGSSSVYGGDIYFEDGSTASFAFEDYSISYCTPEVDGDECADVTFINSREIQ